jgi:prolyl-tRNA editing enzyme YbaK/EbsC (Cys-tRNA(Pro) deacylase)
MNYLDANRIRYAHTTHFRADSAVEVAAAEHMPPHRMAKTVVFGCNKGHVNEGYVMVVPADAYVDVEQVRTAIGVLSAFGSSVSSACISPRKAK